MFATKREKDFREEEEQRLFFQTTSKRLERHIYFGQIEERNFYFCQGQEKKKKQGGKGIENVTPTNSRRI